VRKTDVVEHVEFVFNFATFEKITRETSEMTYIIRLCCGVLAIYIYIYIAISYRWRSFRCSIRLKVVCAYSLYILYNMETTQACTPHEKRHVSCTLPADFGSPYSTRDTVDERRASLYSRLAVSVDRDKMDVPRCRYLRRWNRCDHYNNMPPPPSSTTADVIRTLSKTPQNRCRWLKIRKTRKKVRPCLIW